MFKLDTLTKLAFFIIVIAAPIQWVSLVEIGKSSIKYVHLSIVPMLLCLLFASFRNMITSFCIQYRILLISFITLMMVTFIYTCFNSFNQNVGFSYIFKNLSYILYFVVFAQIVIFRYRRPEFYKELAISNICSVCFFIIIVQVTFASLGRNFILELFQNFLRGDSVAIRYNLFYKLFNTYSDSADTDYQTSLRNTLLGGFIYINFTSLYSLKFCKGKFLKFINLFNIGMSTFLVFASTSRSNMIAMALGYIIYWGLSIYTGQFKVKPLTIFMITLALFIFVLFLPSFQSEFESSTAMIGDRLAKLDEDARWDLDIEALVYFASNPLNGKGGGAVLSDGHRVHNFVLGAAYQTGVFGFILSVIFYFGIFFQLIRSATIIGYNKRLFWFASLVSVPLLRAMTSGNNGTLTIIEWFCLAFFLGVVLQESKAHKVLATGEAGKVKTGTRLISSYY